MKRQLYGLLLLLSFVLGASAQRAQVAKSDAVTRNLHRHIEYLASDKLEGRRIGSSGATHAAGYVANQFARLKLKPGARSSNGKSNYLQPFPYTFSREGGQKVSVTGYNVIGILDGRDRSLRNEAIVIGAHYDHLGHGGEGSLAANSTAIHHGADDNASGTAAIIELARKFVKAKSNKRTIIFIAFSGEEEGLFGSKYYVNSPVFPIAKTVAMLNLDMVGRLHDDKLTIGGIGTASEWKALVEQKNIDGAANLTVNGAERFKLGLNEDGFGPSDHASFYTKKIPVLFFFTGTHLDYHKPTDTADKINYAGEEKVIDYVASIATAIDEMPSRPTYEVAKSSGTGDRRTSSFKVSLGTIPSYTDSDSGLVLDGVRDDSPAAKAGLKAGDKIIRLAGVDVKNIQDYVKALGEMQPDKEYDITVIRGTETITFKIVPVKR